MILRKTVLVLAVITLLLSLVLARKKLQGNARMDQLVGELTQLRDEEPSQFDAFLRNQHRYFLETEPQRQRLRTIYQEIQHSPHPKRLEKTMERYYDWLQSMLQYQRMSHLSLTVDERIEQIRNSLAENREEAYPRFGFGPGRSPWNFAEDSALKNIPNELFLTFYKDRLERFFQEHGDSLSEEKKTEIAVQKNTFSSLFGESPETPGVMTLSALLKVHGGNATNANATLDTLLQDDHLESFRQTLTGETLEAFDKLETERQRFLIRRGILSSLFQHNLNNDFFKKLRPNRLTDAQEKLLREAFGFLPDHEMEQIVKSPPEQFNREVVFYLLPVNYRDRITGMRGMPGGGSGVRPPNDWGGPPGDLRNPPPLPDGGDPPPRF